MPKRARDVRLSTTERLALIAEALLYLVPEPEAQELLEPFSPEHERARRRLLRAGWIDQTGELTKTGWDAAGEIAAGMRPLGTPREDALAEYNHWSDAKSIYATLDSLIAKGLLDKDWEVTAKGWERVAQEATPDILRVTAKHRRAQILELESALESLRKKWAPLEPYLDELCDAPPETPPATEVPAQVAAYTAESLKSARLCIIVGAWAGAIQYCAVAVESVLDAVLVSRGERRRFDELPAMELLVGEVGKKVPQADKLTKNLLAIIKNFRNDSVHPRSPTNRPGEIQARNVYELTTRFLCEVRDDWFEYRVAQNK